MDSFNRKRQDIGLDLSSFNESSLEEHPNQENKSFSLKDFTLSFLDNRVSYTQIKPIKNRVPLGTLNKDTTRGGGLQMISLLG